MHWFVKLLILPLLDAVGARVIVEVGADLGAVTDPLLVWAQQHDAVVHVIDPDPALSPAALSAEHGERLRYHRSRSLEVLGGISGVDLALLDGDHNWYTVINELRALAGAAREQGRDPPVVVVHETGWPYGRRDGYDDPAAIPAAHLQPHARQGIVPGQAELGLGVNEHRENALLEDTAANGVMSAVEDFVSESEGGWRTWPLPGLGGVTVLVDTGTLQSSAALRAVLESTATAEFMRALCEQVEHARIESERKRAGLLRRLTDTQLKQVMRSPDPGREVALKRRVRELTDQVRLLNEEAGRVEELEEQVRRLASTATEDGAAR